MGTYQEFKMHCRDLPGLVRPNLALLADLPFYGFNEEDFEIRLQAFKMVCDENIPIVVTQGGEVAEPGGVPFEPKADEQARLSLAIASLGLGLKEIISWHWNRFVVPLDRGPSGIFAAHALIGVLK